MAIFDFRKKKEEELSSDKTPKFVKVGYDEKHRPVDVRPADGSDIEELCRFSEKDRELIFQWFDYFSRYIELLREDLVRIKPELSKQLAEHLDGLQNDISQMRQSQSEELYQRLEQIYKKIVSLRVPENLATKSDLEAARQEVLKTIREAIVGKDEIVDAIAAKLQITKLQKRPRKNLLEKKERMKQIVAKILNFALKLQQKEKVLIVTDRKMIGLGRMFYRAAREINPKAILMVMAVALRDGEEPDDAVADAMRGSDLVIIVTYRSMTHTDAVRFAKEQGARIASLPNLPKQSLLRGGMTADPEQIKQNTEAMYAVVNGSREIELTAPNGTKLKFSVLGRKWDEDDGVIVDQGKLGNLPGGEVSVGPIENSVQGKVVFDHFPLAKNKIELKIENGIVVKLKGKAKKLRKIFSQFGQDAKTVGEFGIGCNPNARIIGNTLEDEKVFGTVHVALGNNISYGGRNSVPFHEDGIIEKPTVKVDGRVVIRDGKWFV